MSGSRRTTRDGTSAPTWCVEVSDQAHAAARRARGRDMGDDVDARRLRESASDSGVQRRSPSSAAAASAAAGDQVSPAAPGGRPSAAGSLRRAQPEQDRRRECERRVAVELLDVRLGAAPPSHAASRSAASLSAFEQEGRGPISEASRRITSIASSSASPADATRSATAVLPFESLMPASLLNGNPCKFSTNV